MEGLRESLMFGYITASVDCLSVVLVIFIMQATLKKRFMLKKTIAIWLAYTIAFFAIDGIGYTLPYIFGGSMQLVGDFVAIGSMSLLFMLPAKTLYDDHFTSSVFILELSVLIALIATYFSGAISTVFFVGLGLDFGIGWMIGYGLIKIPVLAAFYYLYMLFVLRPAKESVRVLDGKMGRYIPVAIMAIVFFYAFGAITGYTPDRPLQFSLLYSIVCITFGVVFWLIFSGVTWNSRAVKTETELGVASKIQRDMLPGLFPPFPERVEFDIYATMQPAKEVGGDFYDFFLVDEDHLALVIADVSGKGVPAALFMVIAKTIIKNLAQAGLPANGVLEAANKQLCDGNNEAMFVTVFMGIYEISTGKFTYSNAGHNAPLHMKNGEGWNWLKTKPGFVLAGMEGMRFRADEILLSEGDMLYFYTDGVTEALNKKEELYSDPRLIDTLNKINSEERTLEGILKEVRHDIDLFANGAEQADDITMLAFRVDKIGGSGK